MALARRINRTWIVRGGLDASADAYLDALRVQDPGLLEVACAEAIQAARQASAEQRDPKPDFYAALFSRATEEERDHFLATHQWTREKSRTWAAARIPNKTH